MIFRPDISDETLRKSYLEQAKLTQIHRWIGLDDKTPNNGDLFSEDITITVDNEIQPDVALSDVSDFVFKPDNLEFTCFVDDIAATAQVSFIDHDETIPLIKEVQLKTTPEKSKTTKPYNKVKNRILAVNHRWHTLVEMPNKTSEAFKEIISDDFHMEFGHGEVRGFNELHDWVYGSASSVTGARHDLVSLTYEHIKNSTFKAVFVLDWVGLSQDSKRMSARTRHSWIIEDRTEERFAKICHIDVEFLRPFQTEE